MKAAVLLFASILPILVFGQKEGDTWVIGYSSSDNPNYSVMHLNYSSGDLNLEWHFNERLHIRETAAAISDSVGNAILWTNGMQIFGKNGIRIADTIAFDGEKEISYWKWWRLDFIGPMGYPQASGALVLPIPGHSNQYSVIYHLQEYSDSTSFRTIQFLEAKVLRNEMGDYNLIFKDSVFTEPNSDFIDGITATRHANGRDWWIVTLSRDGAKYYSFLLTKDGLQLNNSGNPGQKIRDGVSQSVFSSKGNYFGYNTQNTLTDVNQLSLFNFNRCTGEISHFITLDSISPSWSGVSFSPSERYVYAIANNETLLYQWDLWADDIRASKTLVDTFDGFVQPGWFEMRFGPMVQAPDNRIYVIPSAGSSEFIHVIERPDLPAAECRFEQHKINLLRPNGRSSPNIPNFRLGPLDGSPCDTLGLDNHPVAWWRYEENYPGLWHDIYFTDLSYYNPTSWHWDFGDGVTSTEQYPLHTFDPGLYHVCLTVSNENSSDSMCQWINIIATGTEDPDNIQQDLTVDPNPFSEALVIKSKSGEFRAVHMQLYDIHGKLVFDQPHAPMPVTIYLPDRITPGMYFCRIVEEDGEEYGFKLVRN